MSEHFVVRLGKGRKGSAKVHDADKKKNNR
jgi:hypothetical protein